MRSIKYGKNITHGGSYIYGLQGLKFSWTLASEQWVMIIWLIYMYMNKRLWDRYRRLIANGVLGSWWKLLCLKNGKLILKLHVCMSSYIFIAIRRGLTLLVSYIRCNWLIISKLFKIWKKTKNCRDKMWISYIWLLMIIMYSSGRGSHLIG